RLVGGADACSGRVEIHYGETWGAVCDRNWDIHDADVVCRQLKCFCLSAPGGATFGEGAGPIWGDRVDCQGNESILWECPFTPQGPQNCTHKNAAAVICSGHGGPLLVDGESRCSGRVEILHENKWGSVCDQYLDLEDANVICEHLSCGVAVSVLRGDHFGKGDRPMWKDSFHCRGNESRLWECPTTWDQPSCTSNKTAGVICSGENWQLRLSNGGSRCDGRLEVFYNGTWGRVLDDSWDLNDANVVCRQLDCGSALQAYNSSQYGHGAGPVWLTGVECLGNESALHHCNRPPTGQSDASDDVGLLCSDGTEHMKLHLVGRGGHCSGRVEVYYNGSWGTVCDDQWDLSDAEVVCKQLGCGHAITATTLAVFGEGRGPVWLDDMQCRGNESLLWECPLVEWGRHNCKHREDAGVVCSEHLEVHLAGGDSECSGRVEVRYNGSWGTVCDESWDLNAASVVCRQLDCGSAVAVVSDAGFGEGIGPVWLDEVHCRGSESRLIHCDLFGGFRDCGHKEDAGVVCSGTSYTFLICETGACEGTVEVYSEGRWGTVCSNMWDIPDAEVVCKQLGCGSAVLAPHSNTRVGAFLLNNVRCHGNESHLWQCESDCWDREDCKSESDTLVICSGKETFLLSVFLNISTSFGKQGLLAEQGSIFCLVDLEIRIVEGPSLCHGMVEVNYRGVWGSVCSQSWDLKDAAVVCKQLGCEEPEAAPSSSQYRHTGGSIWLNRVQCTGNESSLWECQAETLGNHECNHWMDVAVICKVFRTLKLILANGSSPCAGRLDVIIGTEKATASDTVFDMRGAEVACRQAHCGSAVSIKRKSYFGEGIGLVMNNKHDCSGSEANIWQCNHTLRKKKIVEPSFDPWLGCVSEDLFQGGADACSGRVEIQYGETWGAVCDRNWDIHDADVVCRQLKCGFAVFAPGGATFGEGAGPIWGDRVDCRGNESILWECPFTPQGPQNCIHKDDAAVICS
uniref:SRCR domain-containing protein n=1 Tax=Latimeria chalumnae TaxID=7897 RepID=H2ZSV0_LATCH